MGPRLRGDDDAGFHWLGWAEGQWTLRMTASTGFSTPGKDCA